jgi:hypothetical protein
MSEPLTDAQIEQIRQIVREELATAESDLATMVLERIRRATALSLPDRDARAGVDQSEQTPSVGSRDT